MGGQMVDGWTVGWRNGWTGGSMAGWTVGQLMVSGCTVGRFLAGHLMVGGRGGVLMSWVGYPQQNPLGVGAGGPRVAPGVLGAGRGPWGGLGLGLLWTWWSDLGEGSNVGFLGWLWAWSHRWECPWGLWGMLGVSAAPPPCRCPRDPLGGYCVAPQCPAALGPLPCTPRWLRPGLWPSRSTPSGRNAPKHPKKPGSSWGPQYPPRDPNNLPGNHPQGTQIPPQEP